jgi:hypothetical protein
MLAVVDQNPTTGTRAIEDCVGVLVGFAALVVLGSGVGLGARLTSDVGLGSEVGGVCASGHDSTMAAIAAKPIHCRATRHSRHPRIEPA